MMVRPSCSSTVCVSYVDLKPAEREMRSSSSGCLWRFVSACHPCREVFVLQPTCAQQVCGRTFRNPYFKRHAKNEGTNQGKLTIPQCSLCGFLLHRVPRKCLKFRLGLHSTPTRFRHICLKESVHYCWQRAAAPAIPESEPNFPSSIGISEQCELMDHFGSSVCMRGKNSLINCATPPPNTITSGSRKSIRLPRHTVNKSAVASRTSRANASPV